MWNQGISKMAKQVIALSKALKKEVCLHWEWMQKSGQVLISHFYPKSGIYRFQLVKSCFGNFD